MFFRKKSKDTSIVPVGDASEPSVGAPVTLSETKNGVDSAAAKVALSAAVPLAPDEAKRRATLAKQFAAAFGETVALMMRAPEYKGFSLADLEWLVAPAITTGQFSVSTAQSKANGAMA